MTVEHVFTSSVEFHHAAEVRGTSAQIGWLLNGWTDWRGWRVWKLRFESICLHLSRPPMTGGGWVEWSGLPLVVKANQVQAQLEEERAEAWQEVVEVAMGVGGPLVEVGVGLWQQVLHCGEALLLQESGSWRTDPQVVVDVWACRWRCGRSCSSPRCDLPLPVSAWRTQDIVWFGLYWNEAQTFRHSFCNDSLLMTSVFFRSCCSRRIQVFVTICARPYRLCVREHWYQCVQLSSHSQTEAI